MVKVQRRGLFNISERDLHSTTLIERLTGANNNAIDIFHFGGSNLTPWLGGKYTHAIVLKFAHLAVSRQE